MSRPRVLCVVSADFGEYVTASLFCRGQPFDAHFALPQALAPFAPADGAFSVYRDLAHAGELVAALHPDVVLLASGHLYAVNRIATLAQLARFVRALRESGAALATTDPWLRIWALRPGSRFAIHSVRKGGVDEAMSDWMTNLQGDMEALLSGMPHVFAVPLEDAERRWLPFFNPAAGQAGRAREADADEWLFVLSREDYVFLAGFEKQAFFAALESRIAELLSRGRNRVRFVAPPDVGRFLAERWGGEPRVVYTGFCDFAGFEALLRGAKVVAYWNLLSSSLLYCLYHGVAPIFFGAGHLAKVCPGLEAHAAQHVYRGRPPRRLDLAAPLGTDADALIRDLHLEGWLSGLRGEYARAPAPAEVVAALRERG